MIGGLSRPVTHNNLAVLRNSETANSDLNRQYHDKRYYTSAIQTHMLSISEELTNLKKKLIENKLTATNYEECKRQVEELAKQLAEHEETLIVYNTGIEIAMFKGSRTDIDNDTESLRRSNQKKIVQLELSFLEKVAREEQLSKLEQKIEMETHLFNDTLNTLSEEKREEYRRLWEENEQYKSQEEFLRNEMKNLKNDINIREQVVVQSDLKRTLYNMLTKLHELKSKRDKLIAEDEIKRSPSQEREYLLEQVKQDRSNLELFKTQEEELNVELEKLKDRKNELEDDLSEKNSARLNKYRELLKRQETMETFLASYDELYMEQVKKLEEYRSSIVYSLEYISGNFVDINFEDMENSHSFIYNSSASKEELKQEFKKLISQLNMLKSIKTHFQKDKERLETQQKEYEEELKTYTNIDYARDNIIERKNALETQRESLKEVMQATHSAVAEADKKNNDLETSLKFNEMYKILNALKNKLNDLTEENERQKSTGIISICNRDSK
ncbi:hypothetical protein CBL_13890 [Carabus blaptoides fortunei]